MIRGTPISRLHQRKDELLAAIERGIVPEWAQDDLPAVMRCVLDNAEPRRIRALKLTQERSERIRATIIDALGALPPDGRGVAGIVYRRIERRDEKPPSMTTIYRTLHSLKISRYSEVEVRRSTLQAVVDFSQPST